MIKTDIVDHYLLFGGRLRIVIKNYLIKYWSFMHGSLRFRLFSRIANTKMHGTWHGCIAEDFCFRVIALKEFQCNSCALIYELQFVNEVSSGPEFINKCARITYSGPEFRLLKLVCPAGQSSRSVCR